MADMSHLYADGYDTDEAADGAQTDFAPIPKGTYRVKVVSVDLNPTKAGTGEMLNVRLDVVGPTQAGRVVFDGILVAHTSPKAQEIGRERLATLARAAGLKNPKDTNLLVGKEVDAFVKIERDQEYGDKNRVSFYAAPKNVGGLNGSTGATSGFNDDNIPF